LAIRWRLMRQRLILHSINRHHHMASDQQSNGSYPQGRKAI
jgi:hypothetical protein